MSAGRGALAPVTLDLACGEQRHELVWADGRLDAPAHPDADRERALAALGADPAPCVQILDAWNRHVDDLDVLLLGSRGPADALRHAEPHPGVPGIAGPAAGGVFRAVSQTGAYSSSLTRTPSFGWQGYRPMPRRYADYGAHAPLDDLSLLFSLGAGLPERLAATVITTWAERVEEGDDRVAAATPALDAALYGRVRTALLPWLGRPSPLALAMQPPDREPVLAADGDGVRAALPFAWLRDVWVPGLAVILDRFCVRAEHGAPDRWRLTTVGRDLRGPTKITITG